MVDLKLGISAVKKRGPAAFGWNRIQFDPCFPSTVTTAPQPLSLEMEGLLTQFAVLLSA